MPVLVVEVASRVVKRVVLFELRGLAQNYLLGIRPLRRLLHQYLGSTGMNGDREKSRARLAAYLEHVEIRERDVLELGPGHTIDVLELAREAGAARCVGLDVELLVDEARLSASGVEVAAYDGVSIPFDARTFDVIWSSDVFEHVRHPKQVVVECFRTLRPGGAMLAAIDLRDHYFLDREERWLSCLKYPEPLWLALTSNRSSFVNRLRSSEWRALFEAAGFVIDRWDEQMSPVLERLYHEGRVSRFGRALKATDAPVFRIDVVVRRPNARVA